MQLFFYDSIVGLEGASMTGALTTDPAALAKAAASFEAIAENLKAVISRVQSTAAELTGEANWKGAAAAAAKAALQRFNDAVTAQVGQLNDISTNLDSAGVQYSVTDDDRARALEHAMNLDGDDDHEHKAELVGEHDKNDPRIEGPGSDPKREGLNTGKQDDLDTTIPGTGIALGGDGKDKADGYPRIHVPGVYDGKNPLPVPPGTRPLPTGTAVGPNGEHYGFYAIVPYFDANGNPNLHYTSPDTVVVDLAHPATPLYTLHGISQASGAYDAQSGRMIIMGNGPDGQRGLWQSAPISQNPAWGKAPLESMGTFEDAMNGNRESQLVALPKGGLMAVGASETPNGQTLPLEAATSSDVRGLLTAPPTEIVNPNTLPQVYGPTVTDIRAVDGKEVVTVRVSTFGDADYDPHTYTTTYTVDP